MRGTTFLDDDRYPELWAPSVQHDIDSEGELHGWAFDQEFVAECQRIYERLIKATDTRAYNLFELGYQQYRYRDRWQKAPLGRERSDKEFRKYMRRVVLATTDHERRRQLCMATGQRYWLVSAPPMWLRKAFLSVWSAIGGEK